MDTGAIGRSQTPPKVAFNTASQNAGTANPDTVRAAAGKSVPQTDTQEQDVAFDDATSREKDQANLEQPQARIDRRTVIDPETETLLFQMIEENTGEVKVQIPDDVLLNVREYARESLENGQKAREDAAQSG